MTLNDRDIQFQLYQVFDLGAMLENPRYRDHDRETVDSFIAAARRIAEVFFAPFNSKADANEPVLEGDQVRTIPELKAAWQQVAQAGFLGASHDYEDGGLQVPDLVMRACMAHLSAANVAFAGYPFLTIGAANLIQKFASEEQKARFLGPMLEGRFAGTMALTEADQGSSLADIKTLARANGGGHYLLTGSKMFISAGEHGLTENIVHMVLAKISGGAHGTHGISLFICPKFLVNDDQSIGARNDVQVAGLLHKMGYRQTTSTALNFGDNGQCVAYLVGEPGKGLRYMFQMMNEARIGVGAGAMAIGYAGYQFALQYARERPQGRLPSSRSGQGAQIPIVEHADVKRMLLAQKAYVEGSLCLCMYASALVDQERSSEDKQARETASALLDLLTPLVKYWPSEYALKANDLAIQVLGGSGYMREFPVEQLYRDNRLNPIHEGTTGIQAIDLLGRKLGANRRAAFKQLIDLMRGTSGDARAAGLESMAQTLEAATETLDKVSVALLRGLDENLDLGLANATVFLDMFGRVVLSWLWLRQAVAARQSLDEGGCSQDDESFYHGKIQAARYYLEWELPQMAPQADLLLQENRVCFDMQDAWF